MTQNFLPSVPFLRRYFMLAVAVFAILAMAVAGLWKSAASALNGKGAAALASGTRSTLVASYSARTREFSDRIHAIGTAQAYESVDLSASQTEIIARIFFESGQYVTKGAPLIQLAGREEDANSLEAKADLANAKRDYDRYSALARTGIAAQARLDDTRAALDRAKARVQAVEARQADRLIRAPFSGVIGLRDKSPGTLARPGDPLATLDDISRIKLDFRIAERYFAGLRAGDTIEARADAFPDKVFSGTIANIDSRLDPVTRSIRARAVFANPKGDLHPGMLLNVSVKRQARLSLAVPDVALILDGPKAYVLRLDAADPARPGGACKVVRNDVVPGVSQDGFTEILQGLAPGTPIIAEGVNRVRPGETVDTQSANADAAASQSPAATPGLNGRTQ